MHYLPTVTNHISNPLSSVHPICINSLINFVLELVSHLLRVKQWKKQKKLSVIFHVDRLSVESTFELIYHFVINTLRPRQHFPDDILKSIFLNENVWLSIKISWNVVPQGPINNIPALVQIMAGRRPGDNPLSEPMMVILLTHIWVTRRQWVKHAFTCPTKRFMANSRKSIAT